MTGPSPINDSLRLWPARAGDMLPKALGRPSVPAVHELADRYGDDAAIWIRYGLIALAAVVAALVLHAVLFRLLARAAARTRGTGDDVVLRHLRRPTRVLVVLLALAFAEPWMDLGPIGRDWWRFGEGLVVPAIVGWLVAGLLGALNGVVQARHDLDAPDDLDGRRRRTRVGILYRVALFVVLLVTVCLMLISIPEVRSIGVTLVASAGIGALAVGAAAQPALKNIIAGIQMAFSEPIRIGDQVVVGGEWGRVEEIRLTYVVIAVWDQRRLVVPVSKFLEDSFQNWTRSSTDLLGVSLIHVDRTADVPRLRARLAEVVAADPLWDGRVCGLQVTDSLPGWMELRCLTSAANAGATFDLRCNVREAMNAFIAAEMPDALPRARGVTLPADMGAALAGQSR